MTLWTASYFLLSVIFAVVSFIPATGWSHWFFRMFDFIRIQLFVVLLFLFVFGFYAPDGLFGFGVPLRVVMVLAMIYHLVKIVPYIPITKKKPQDDDCITLLSVNVMQSNKQYERLIHLIKKTDPDILLTMETNLEWEEALKAIEDTYGYSLKVPKENRYGMHCYTKLKVRDSKVHYLISEDYPSMEIEMTDRRGMDFSLWGIHPPPPSPTEKSTSRQKDAELIQAAQIIRQRHVPTIASGDFNNVCWSKSSNLFAKVSGLKDARKGRGLHSTFPVRPKIMRFPLDLLFHSKVIDIRAIKTLPEVGSDHLPVLSIFSLTADKAKVTPPIDQEVKEEARTIIQEGNASVQEEKKEKR